MSMKANLLAAALLALAPAAHASAGARVTGYVTASDGQPVTDAFGECRHTRDWKPGMRLANCEPRPPARPAPFRLSADTLFEFDSAALTPHGRVALDRLERRIGGAGYDSVKITGHTDRLRAPSYNQRLSERRAGAVRTYLAAHGLDAARISAKGVGSAHEVTVLGTARTASAQWARISFLPCNGDIS